MNKKTMFVSFSGGRTSGYMCHYLIQNKSDEYDFIFVFANTGLEHEKTLEFVDKCDKHFGLNLVWVEAVVHEDRVACTHKKVDFKSAARTGAPFEKVIEKYGITNKDWPHCTRELKLSPMMHYKRSIGFPSNALMAIGIRSDEIDRMSPTAKENGLIYPLCTMTQTTEADIRHWWAKQPFDLDLPTHMGNCVTCWKKSDRKLKTIARHNPEYFDFMDRMEREHPRSGHTGGSWQDRVFFRKKRTAQDILLASKTPFVEFVDEMPPLQVGMFDDQDIEEDCGSGCEIM